MVLWVVALCEGNTTMWAAYRWAVTATRGTVRVTSLTQRQSFLLASQTAAFSLSNCHHSAWPQAPCTHVTPPFSTVEQTRQTAARWKADDDPCTAKTGISHESWGAVRYLALCIPAKSARTLLKVVTV